MEINTSRIEPNILRADVLSTSELGNVRQTSAPLTPAQPKHTIAAGDGEVAI
jgi:hypothetical protein